MQNQHDKTSSQKTLKEKSFFDTCETVCSSVKLLAHGLMNYCFAKKRAIFTGILGLVLGTRLTEDFNGGILNNLRGCAKISMLFLAFLAPVSAIGGPVGFGIGLGLILMLRVSPLFSDNISGMISHKIEKRPNDKSNQSKKKTRDINPDLQKQAQSEMQNIQQSNVSNSQPIPNKNSRSRISP